MTMATAANAAIPSFKWRPTEDAVFNESDHPRGPDGKFGATGFHGSPNKGLSVLKNEPGNRQFDNATSQLGVFFAPDRKGAERYAGPEGQVYQANINLKKPYDMPTSEFLYLQNPTKDDEGMSLPGEKWGERAEQLKQEAIGLRKQLEQEGHDGVVIRNSKGQVLEISSFADVPVGEPEHANDAAILMAMDRSMGPRADSRFVIAQDRDTVREKTRDGRLVVKKTNISKANVCPYKGEEIPGYEELGLDPQRVYNLLRDPEELAKAAPTLNGVQLLIKHIPVNAEDHRPYETVGSLGTDAAFDGEYLTNSLFVNARAAIDVIENGKQQELSAGYHYKPDMTPGNFRGSAYDGVMRDIVFNHVALVEDGRAGPDVIVADEALKESKMAKATRFGAMVLALTGSQVAPLLAQDQKITLSKDLFASLTSKNFTDGKTKLLAGVRLAMDGKLKSGVALDASMEKIGKAFDDFSSNMGSMDEPAPEDKMDDAPAIEAAKPLTDPGATYDAEPMKAYLRDCGMDEEKIAKCMDMMPKNGMAGDEDDDEAKKKAEEEKKAKEAAAKDEFPDKDKDKDKPVDKPAMDAALKAQADHFQKELQKVRDTERGVRVAIAEVHPWTGDLPATMAFDSAADVYRHALVMKNVDGAKTLHQDALLPILKTLPKNGATAAPRNDGTTHIAMDSSAVGKAIKMAPDLANISTVL